MPHYSVSIDIQARFEAAFAHDVTPDEAHHQSRAYLTARARSVALPDEVHYTTTRCRVVRRREGTRVDAQMRCRVTLSVDESTPECASVRAMELLTQQTARAESVTVVRFRDWWRTARTWLLRGTSPVCYVSTHAHTWQVDLRGAKGSMSLSVTVEVSEHR